MYWGLAVYFFDGQKGSSSEVVGSNDDDAQVHLDIAVMAVHFWSCDDRYGSPRVGDLQSKSVQTNDRNDAPSSTT